jgi:hypothetical protein
MVVVINFGMFKRTVVDSIAFEEQTLGPDADGRNRQRMCFDKGINGIGTTDDLQERVPFVLLNHDSRLSGSLAVPHEVGIAGIRIGIFGRCIEHSNFDECSDVFVEGFDILVEFNLDAVHLDGFVNTGFV